MTPDEATLAAGRVFETWPTCRIAFDVWEAAFIDFPDPTAIHRAIDRTAQTCTAGDLSIRLVLSNLTAPPPPAGPPPTPHQQRTTIVPPANTDPHERMLSADARQAGLNRVAWLRRLIDDARNQRPAPPASSPPPFQHETPATLDPAGINDEPSAGGVAA